MMVLLAELYLSYNFQWSWLYFKVTATSNSLKWKFHVLQRTWNLVWLFIFLDEILKHNTLVTFAFIDTFLYQQNLEHLPVFPWILCEWSRFVMAWLKPCLGSTDLYQWPWREPWMSDFFPLSGLSGLSFDSTLLSPFLFICLLPLLVLSQLFGLFCKCLFLFRKFFNIFC